MMYKVTYIIIILNDTVTVLSLYQARNYIHQFSFITLSPILKDRDDK
jgi:hypothetical protein